MSTFTLIDVKGKKTYIAAKNLAQAKASVENMKLVGILREATAAEEQALWNSHSLPQEGE